MKYINLTKGFKTMVDDEDYAKVIKRTWHFEHGYARSSYPTYIYMHQLILGKSGTTDHINGNGLDNRRINLRKCTARQNSLNHGFNKNNTSGYKGVGWHKQVSKWRAYIEVNKKHISLGLFENKKEAALAYNTAAKKHFGEFAKINTI